MKIEKITLKNFKCHKELSQNLGKITLVTGANSSGKSSILYSLLSILQSKSFPRDWELNGDYVSMGDYAELVHNHDIRETIGVGIELEEADEKFALAAEFKHNEATKLAKLSSFKIASKCLNASFRNEASYIGKIDYTPSRDPKIKVFKDETFRKMLLSMADIAEKDTEDGKTSTVSKRGKHIKEMLEDFSGVRSIDIKTKTLKDFNDIIARDFLVYQKMTQLGQISERLISWFSYVGPFRYSPDRTYYRAARKDLRVGVCGENYIEQLLHWSEFDPNKFSAIIETLEKMGLASSIRFKKFSGGRYEVRIKARKGSPLSNITDVGLGVSQFLPVLVADFQLQDGGTALVAQPEIHLHPSAQAAYGSFIADRTSTKKNRYIIETHSEYLINRLRLMIAEGTLAESDVKIIHVAGGKSSKIH